MTLADVIQEIEKNKEIVLQDNPEEKILGEFKFKLNLVYHPDRENILTILRDLYFRMDESLRYFQEFDVKSLASDDEEALKKWYGETQVAKEVLEDAVKSGLLVEKGLTKAKQYIEVLTNVDNYSNRAVENAFFATTNLLYKLIDKYE